MKKLLTIGITFAAALTLAACGSNSSSNSSSSKAEKATKVDSSKESSKKASSASAKGDSVSIPTTADKDWFFNSKKNVFYAGNETMTLTKSEVRDGIEDGSKVLVIYTTIRNNSDKEQDPSNFYMVVHAKQKTDTSNVTLDPGMLKSGDDGKTPLQSLEDNLNNALLPGKTIETVLTFGLKNTNPVTVEFSDANLSTVLGTKTYEVK